MNKFEVITMNQQKKLTFIFIFLILLSLGFLGAHSGSTQEEQFLFEVLFIAPTSRYPYIQYAQIIASELSKIGIDAKLLLAGWNVFIPRMFDSPSHADYTGGGFDLGCLKWSDSIVPSSLYTRFHSSNESPLGDNYYPVINQTLDGILELVMNTTDFNERKAYIKQALEMIVWEIHPVSTIFQPESVCYMRDNVKGYSSKLRVPGALGVAEMYFEDGRSHGHGQVNEFIMASRWYPAEYNDLIENRWANQLAIGPLNHGLVERDSDYNFVPVLLTQLPYPMAITNNHTGLESSLDPNLATVWEIELRNDVFWHEGYGYTMAAHEDMLKVDADDVLFTFDLILDDNGPSPCAARPNWQRLLGNDISLAVIKKDRYHVQFHLQTVDPDIMANFGQYLMPQHILALGTIRADGSMAPTDYADWDADDWNTGHRTVYTGPAVIGNGPYVLFPGENYTSYTLTETKNPYWHLKDEPAYANMFEKYIYTWIISKDAALAALESAEIDLIDPQADFSREFPVMANKPGIFTLKQLDWEYYTVGYNILHGAGDKLANKWTRLAIAHMIPYQDIVDDLLNGLGQTNCAPFPKQSPFWPVDLQAIEYNQTKALNYLEKAGYDVTPFQDGGSQENSTSSFILPNGLLIDPLTWILLTTFGLEVIVISFLLLLIRRKQRSINNS